MGTIQTKRQTQKELETTQSLSNNIVDYEMREGHAEDKLELRSSSPNQKWSTEVRYNTFEKSHEKLGCAKFLITQNFL